MIKFISTNSINKRRMLGIGLTRENIDKLINRLPIHFHAEQLKIIDKIEVNEVLIFFGETEEDIYKDLKEAGYLEGTHIIRETSIKQ